jgi:hypothetical protein
MDDVDWILRRGEDIALARRVLEKCGYAPGGEAFPNIWAREGFLIDLHTDILGEERRAFRMDAPEIFAEKSRIVAEIYSRAQTSLLGEPYLVPSPEDHLIILCAHMMKQNFESGIWFSDLEALLSCEPDFGWEVFLGRAEAWGLIRPVAYAFKRVGALGDERRVTVPPEALGRLREVRPTRLDGALLALSERGLTLAGEKDAWRHPPVANLFWLSSRRGLWAKARLLWEAAFPAGGAMAEIYPSYRPALRWWFLARRAGDLFRLGARVLAVSRAGRSR